MERDKASLDVFWLRDESLDDGEDLPPPEVLVAEIAEDLEAALTQFAAIAETISTPSDAGLPGSDSHLVAWRTTMGGCTPRR